MADKVTMKIDRDVYERLVELKRGRETMSDVLKRLLEGVEE